jgi:hypothetical protein
MPTREQTIADAVQILESAVYPSGLNSSSAWLGIYQTLLWHEPVHQSGFDTLPHIIDADKLRPSPAAKSRSHTGPSVWQQRARAINEYLAQQLNCTVADVPDKTDLLMKLSGYQGMQRQNTLGIAFAGLIKHVLEKFGSHHLSYQSEVEASTIFAGITVPGRSNTPRIDLLSVHDGVPRAIISAKWSVRHDRLNDITNECPVYKAAYQRIYRQSRRELLYYVVTNEYDPSRLTKMLDDSCVDGIVHIHKSGVVDVCGLNGRLAKIIDLADFVKSTNSW